MSSKWKYASLDADTRLEMLRSGNKDVFDEEVERTKSVTNARRELGLDTTEQENWMDTVGYNYSLYNGAAQGESKDNISKSGYAKIYLKSEKDKENEPMSKVKEYKTTSGLKSTPISDAIYKIKSAGEQAKKAIREKYATMKEQAREDFYKKYPYLNEAILNSGASLEGGKAAKIRADLDAELAEIYTEYDKAMEKELSASENKYAGLVETLLGYRRDGYAKSALGSLADMLIKSAAAEDGYKISDSAGSTGKVISVKKLNDILESGMRSANENIPKASSSAVTQAVETLTDGDAYAAGKTSNVQGASAGGVNMKNAAKELVKLSESLGVQRIVGLLMSYGVSASDAKDIAERLSSGNTGA